MTNYQIARLGLYAALFAASLFGTITVHPIYAVPTVIAFILITQV